jgi:predicted ester cyclase
MSVEQNKASARRFVEEHNGPNYLAAFDDLLADGAVVHEYLPGVPESMDRAAYEQFIGSFRAALPDIHNTVESVIGEGDLVSARWTGTGTHTGEALMGIPASGAGVRAHGTYTFRFSGDRIAEIWNNWDNLNVLQQMGGLQ